MRLLIPLIALVLWGCGSSPEPKLDKHGKTPSDYAKVYYEATNKDDYETVKSLMSEKFYLSFAEGPGKPASFERFKEEYARHMRKHNGYIFNPSSRRSGFHSNNAEGVYSFGATIKMKPDDFKSLPYELNDELCFRLFNNEWKIVNKLKGE